MVKRWEGAGVSVNFAQIPDTAVTDRRGGLGESDDKLFWQNDKSGPVAGWRAVRARWCGGNPMQVTLPPPTPLLQILHSCLHPSVQFSAGQFSIQYHKLEFRVSLIIKARIHQEVSNVILSLSHGPNQDNIIRTH